MICPKCKKEFDINSNLRIDPKSGTWAKCSHCGYGIDLEDSDGDLG
jgi:DNA-directed RNA polymerase subunit RPC12/RpoP